MKLESRHLKAMRDEVCNITLPDGLEGNKHHSGAFPSFAKSHRERG